VVATGNLTSDAYDETIVVQIGVGSGAAITLAAAPPTGTIQIIKDGAGNAASKTITVQPTSGLIDGSSIIQVGVNWGSVTVQYTGSGWIII
jgi:hypothetical protein